MKIALDKTAEDNVFLLVNISKDTVDLLIVVPMEDSGIYKAKIALLNNAVGSIFMHQDELNSFLRRVASLDDCAVYAV